MRHDGCLGDRDQVDTILAELRAVITKAEGLGDYAGIAQSPTN